jgi:hypothetical protein
MTSRSTLVLAAVAMAAVLSPGSAAATAPAAPPAFPLIAVCTAVAAVLVAVGTLVVVLTRPTGAIADPLARLNDMNGERDALLA